MERWIQLRRKRSSRTIITSLLIYLCLVGPSASAMTMSNAFLSTSGRTLAAWRRIQCVGPRSSFVSYRSSSSSAAAAARRRRLCPLLAATSNSNTDSKGRRRSGDPLRGAAASSKRHESSSSISKEQSLLAAAEEASSPSPSPSPAPTSPPPSSVSTLPTTNEGLMIDDLSTRSSSSIDQNLDQEIQRLRHGGKEFHPYWCKRLSLLQRPAARALVNQLIPSNALGFDAGPTLLNRKGTLFDYVLQQKKAHPDKVVLTRVGEFYETYGIDALMMIEYAGLNPMGNKAKAGCPIKNIQATLDGLTGAGLTVAVLEELNELDTGSSRTKLKTRVLAQVVSPGASTYLYDCCLRPDDVEFKENRPYIGLMRSPSGGFTVVEAHLDAKTARLTERMTEEAVRIALQAGGLAEPLYIQGVDAELLRALLPPRDLERRDLNGHSPEQFHQAVIQCLGRDLEVDVSDMRVIHNPPLEARPRPVYLSTALQIGLLPNPNVPDLVRCLLPQQHWAHSARFLRRWLLTPPPFYLADAMQDLCQGLAYCSQGPPQCRPIAVGKLVSMLSLRQCNVPLFRDVHGCVSAVLILLQDHSSSPSSSSPSTTVPTSTSSTKTNPFHALVPSLRAIVAYESGLDVPEEILRTKGLDALEAIEDVVCAIQGTLTPPSSAAQEDSPSIDSVSGLVPSFFFERNEEVFRNTVRPDHPSIAPAYAIVEAKAQRLCELIAEDFPPSCEIVMDYINNALMLKRKPPSSSPSSTQVVSEEGQEGVEINQQEELTITKSRNTKKQTRIKKKQSALEYIHPTDRNRKPIPKRYTTRRVEDAIGDYLEAVDRATLAVRKTLQALSDRLKEDLPVLITALHFAVVLQAASAHVAAARQRGWKLPTLISPPSRTEEAEMGISPFHRIKGGERGRQQQNPSISTSYTAAVAYGKGREQEGRGGRIGGEGDWKEDWTMRVEGLVPYWMPKGTGVENTLDLRGIFLLTAPNMSGKSTLMRSLAVAALLANCGLYVPVTKQAQIPRYDNVFVRTASYDVPAEGKSAFALEMDDVRVMLRDCTSRSLVFLDEIGKGTSARDGAALSGALLEALDEVPVTTVFATHLHELFELPLRTRNVSWKRMGLAHRRRARKGGLEDEEEEIYWTYTLEDGKCLDSMALHTARAYGIPQSILTRATELGQAFDHSCRGAGGRAEGRGEEEDCLKEDEEIEREEDDGLSSFSPVGPYRTLEEAVQVMQSVVKTYRTDAEPPKVLTVQEGFDPASGLEGSACVYVLRISSSSSSSTPTAPTPFCSSSPTSSSFYVGETESIRKRLGQHRTRLGRSASMSSPSTPQSSTSSFAATAAAVVVEAAVMPVSSKTEGRSIEAAVIRELKNRGYPLISDKDGSRQINL